MGPTDETEYNKFVAEYFEQSTYFSSELEKKQKYIEYNFEQFAKEIEKVSKTIEKFNYSLYGTKDAAVELLTDQATTAARLATKAQQLPGYDKSVPSKYLCECFASMGEYYQYSIGSIVMHLNDSIRHRWTREQIADWLEKIDEDPENDIDLEFKIPELEEK